VASGGCGIGIAGHALSSIGMLDMGSSDRIPPALRLGAKLERDEFRGMRVLVEAAGTVDAGRLAS